MTPSFLLSPLESGRQIPPASTHSQCESVLAVRVSLLLLTECSRMVSTVPRLVSPKDVKYMNNQAAWGDKTVGRAFAR